MCEQREGFRLPLQRGIGVDIFEARGVRNNSFVNKRGQIFRKTGMDIVPETLTIALKEHLVTTAIEVIELLFTIRQYYIM